MVVAPPQPPQLEPGPEALIEEVRARQRRRQRLTALTLAILVGAGTGSYLLVSGGSGRGPRPVVPVHTSAVVNLGVHHFGSFRAAESRVAAAWGNGPRRAGFEHADYGNAGASSYAVDAAGDVFLLDQLHSRILRYAPGSTRPAILPLRLPRSDSSTFTGVEDDLAVGSDGVIYAIEPSHSNSPDAALWSFPASGGRPIAQVDVGPENPIVRTVGTVAYVPFTLGTRWPAFMKSGHPLAGPPAVYGEPLGGGARLNLDGRVPDVTITINSRPGSTRVWHIRSKTAFGIDLAQALDGDLDRLVVVLTTYTNTQAEGEVLVVGSSGRILQRFDVPQELWASQYQDNSQFRLSGHWLYRLGSNPIGVFVDRYDLTRSGHRLPPAPRIAPAGASALRTPTFSETSPPLPIPAALRHVSGHLVMTRVRVVPAGKLRPELAGCGDGYAPYVPAGRPAVLRVDDFGLSLTYAWTPSELHACDDVAAAPHRLYQRWWNGSGSIGGVRGGVASEARTDHVYEGPSSGLPFVGFEWVEPKPGAKWVVSKMPGATEIFPLAANLPVRIVTTSMDGFRYSEYDKNGRLIYSHSDPIVIAG